MSQNISLYYGRPSRLLTDYLINWIQNSTTEGKLMGGKFLTSVSNLYKKDDTLSTILKSPSLFIMLFVWIINSDLLGSNSFTYLLMIY